MYEHLLPKRLSSVFGPKYPFNAEHELKVPDTKFKFFTSMEFRSWSSTL